MPPERRRGMDHDHYPWSPIVTRPKLVWPNDARVALAVVVSLEHMEWKAPPDSVQPPGLYSNLAMQRPLAELWSASYREYGHRIGLFRLLDLLEKHSIRPTIALDAMTASGHPFVVQHCVNKGYEFIAHGVAATRMITSKMSEAEERLAISESIAAVRTATGSSPKGWLGPEYGESTRTPTLLADAGIEYLCDWTNDEQPYRMSPPRGELFALPLLGELDDLFAIRDRKFQMDEYADQIVDAFDVVYRDAATTGRLFALNFHPWIMGQPFRIRFLDAALTKIMNRPGIWSASGSEIIAAYRSTLQA